MVCLTSRRPFICCHEKRDEARIETNQGSGVHPRQSCRRQRQRRRPKTDPKGPQRQTWSSLSPSISLSISLSPSLSPSTSPSLSKIPPQLQRLCGSVQDSSIHLFFPHLPRLSVLPLGFVIHQQPNTLSCLRNDNSTKNNQNQLSHTPLALCIVQQTHCYPNAFHKRHHG